jgi:hypothetical protein
MDQPNKEVQRDAKNLRCKYSSVERLMSCTVLMIVYFLLENVDSFIVDDGTCSWIENSTPTLDAQCYFACSYNLLKNILPIGGQTCHN